MSKAYFAGPEAGLRFIETWTNAAALFVVRELEDKSRSILSARFAGFTAYQP